MMEIDLLARDFAIRIYHFLKPPATSTFACTKTKESLARTSEKALDMIFSALHL